MSRNYRGRGFQPRWGLCTTHNDLKVQPGTKVEQVAYLNRLVKRANKAAGYKTAKTPSVWAFIIYHIPANDGVIGTVEAHTRSEARAEVKKLLGLSKNKPLTQAFDMEKVDRDTVPQLGALIKGEDLHHKGALDSTPEWAKKLLQRNSYQGEA